MKCSIGHVSIRVKSNLIKFCLVKRLAEKKTLLREFNYALFQKGAAFVIQYSSLKCTFGPFVLLRSALQTTVRWCLVKHAWRQSSVAVVK